MTDRQTTRPIDRRQTRCPAQPPAQPRPACRLAGRRTGGCARQRPPSRRRAAGRHCRSAVRRARRARGCVGAPPAASARSRMRSPDVRRRSNLPPGPGPCSRPRGADRRSPQARQRRARQPPDRLPSLQLPVALTARDTRARARDGPSARPVTCMNAARTDARARRQSAHPRPPTSDPVPPTLRALRAGGAVRQASTANRRPTHPRPARPRAPHRA